MIDEAPICMSCMGSGEGRSEGSSCRDCRGTGLQGEGRRREEEAMEYGDWLYDQQKDRELEEEK